MRRALAAAVLALLLAGGAAGQAPPRGVTSVGAVEGIAEYRLANGLQVLLVEDASKPTTTVNLTYRVGSRHENYGETGMAHLLEHLLFKGSPKHRAPWADFEKRGLAANGTTWYDRTNYTASFSANDDNLRWYLGWLADSMTNSFIARRDLDTEMTVVRNEMEAGENSPDQMLFSRLLSAMYDWHNYANDPIGARADVENVDIPRLQAFYRMYYQPDNATLIVAGRFDAQRTLATIAQAFGVLKKPTRKLPVLYTLEPVQDGERSVVLRRVGGAPMVLAGYHMPPGPHTDFAAAELLPLILGDAPSGRLHRRLTEKGLAAATFGYTKGLADPGFLVMGAQLAPGQDMDRARAALLAVLEGVAAEPIGEAEVKRAKAKWLKGWEQVFTNPEAIGLSLSESIAQGDWRLYFLMRDRVRDVALADVQRVAAQRLIADNRTLGIHVPTDKPQRAPAPQRVDLAKTFEGFRPQAAAAAVEAFDATPANIDARTQRLALGGLQVALLPKGTRGGAVRAVLTLRLGDETSLAGQTEAANAVAALLDKGSATLDRQQVQDRLDELRTELVVGSVPGRVTVTLNSRRETLPAAIALVGDLLRRPAFPADAFDEYRRQTVTAIEQQRKEPDALVQNAVDRLGNPYPRGDVRHARSYDEWLADLDRLTLDQVRVFHRRFYGTASAQFAAVGDLDPAAVRAALAAAFDGWRAELPVQRVPQPLVAVAPARLVLATPDKQNANLLVRQALPIDDRDPDHAALMMANHLLGVGGNSRLWIRIREKDGLSYDVRTEIRWNPFEAHSVWEASAIFAPQNRARVEAAFSEELGRALNDGFGAKELDEGRRGLLNFRRLGRAQDASVAGALRENLYLDRSFARAAQLDAQLAALTLDQVNAVLRKYLKPEAFVLGFAGDFK